MDSDSSILPTHSLELTISVLASWIESKFTGGIVWGYGRVGKSKAIAYMLASGAEALGVEIPMVSLDSWRNTKTSNTENRWYEEVLRSLAYVNPTTGNAGTKLDRIVGSIQARVRNAKEYRFIFFIDEAQQVSTDQLHYHKDIYNRLKKKNIVLITILFGDATLPETKNELRRDKNNYLLSRFMTGEHQYAGVSEEKHLKRFLHSLDEQSEYPRGSGTSYTAHFLPKAFDAGWRLANQSSLIWKTYHRVTSEAKLPKFGEFPMIAITTAMNSLLKTTGKQDHPEFVLERVHVEEAIYCVAIEHLIDFSVHYL